jgi:HlyD family secretion protein
VKKSLSLIVLLAAAIAAGAWYFLRPATEGAELVEGNGRIEATEIDVATKIAGRVQELLVNEGDFVTAGQVVARIQSKSIEAQLAEAEAQHRQAQTAVTSAEAAVAARESDKLAAEAVVVHRQAEWTAQQQRLGRTERLTKQGVLPPQTLDDDRAATRSGEAAVSAAKAQVTAAEAAIQAAKAQVKGARSTTEAAQATIARIKSDLDDCALRAPRDGRVQYRVTQISEVLGVGGKVLNLVDLADVYMTFFLPEKMAGRVALGSDVRLVLDAAPDFIIPAKVSYVSSVAQFTPKTVETASERQKLMFRVKARIDPELLQRHLQQVKTGLPGVAWLKLDAQAEWPTRLAVKVP